MILLAVLQGLLPGCFVRQEHLRRHRFHRNKFEVWVPLDLCFELIRSNRQEGADEFVTLLPRPEKAGSTKAVLARVEPAKLVELVQRLFRGPGSDHSLTRIRRYPIQHAQRNHVLFPVRPLRSHVSIVVDSVIFLGVTLSPESVRGLWATHGFGGLLYKPLAPGHLKLLTGQSIRRPPSCHHDLSTKADRCIPSKASSNRDTRRNCRPASHG